MEESGQSGKSSCILLVDVPNVGVHFHESDLFLPSRNEVEATRSCAALLRKMETSFVKKGLGVVQYSHLLSPPPQLVCNKQGLNINVLVEQDVRVANR